MFVRKKAIEIKNNRKMWTLKEKVLGKKEKCKENGKRGKHGEEETEEREGKPRKMLNSF